MNDRISFLWTDLRFSAYLRRQLLEHGLCDWTAPAGIVWRKDWRIKNILRNTWDVDCFIGNDSSLNEIPALEKISSSKFSHWYTLLSTLPISNFTPFTLVRKFCAVYYTSLQIFSLDISCILSDESRRILMTWNSTKLDETRRNWTKPWIKLIKLTQLSFWRPW